MTGARPSSIGATQQLFRDACVVHGPHLGYDPNAADAAKTAVRAFLKTAFKLD